MVDTPRPYQQQGITQIKEAWARGFSNVLYQLPTGGGKTFTFSSIIRDNQGPACAIAHRQELVTQISLALAKQEVRHQIIGPRAVVKNVVNTHRRELGRDFYDPNALTAVAGVKTLTSKSRRAELEAWANQVTLWVMDECHHVLRGNTWGKAVELFPNALGLGVTATPIRSDNKGLGDVSDGFFNKIIEGPTMRWLIDNGYLCDYKIFAPQNDLDLSDVSLDATGDYNRQKLKAAIRKSRVVGDVVDQYIKIANGKLGITFATDVDTATDIANAYNAQGIPAEIVSAKTPDNLRQEIIRRFANREILNLVNVDLFGEGFDLPAIEVCSFARPTMSFALYAQHFGRALRIMEGKERAIIIDHVNNVMRHGLPDAVRDWTLQRPNPRRAKRSGNDVIETTTCSQCTGVYSNLALVCPYCGFINKPQSKGSIESVAGDLTELTPEILEAMRKEKTRIDGPPRVPQHLNGPARKALENRWYARQELQHNIRAAIAWWCGYWRDVGETDGQIYKRFYYRFGKDILTCQTLGGQDAYKIINMIHAHMSELVKHG